MTDSANKQVIIQEDLANDVLRIPTHGDRDSGVMATAVPI